MKEAFQLPLYQLFKRFQQYDKSLKHKALDSWSYLRMLEVLGEGYGLLSKEDLFALCQIFWLKPHHDREQFRLIFDNHITTLLAQINAPVSPTDPQSEKEDIKKQKPKKEKEDTSTNLDQAEKDKKEPKEADQPGTDKTTQQEDYETVSLSFRTGTEQEQFLDTNNENWKKDIFKKSYRLRGKYLPVHPRRIQQSMRSLRIMQSGKGKTDIDWAATIERISRQGYLDTLQFKRIPIISTDANVLIDIGGSMIAFRQLTKEIIQAVQRGKKQQSKVFYFRNCPVKFLYKDKDLTQAIPLNDFKRKNKIPLFIISDAGAARGRYDKERIKLTKKFLNGFNPSEVVWLNPMPRNRWPLSSASYIEQMVNMFEINNREFGNAVRVFKDW
ncbi:MAG TPA: hypothetical protein ENK52_06955 [Saprospiraceae bacterium]|nr:hypothetical protein [Saprospiraceae bacterium]